MEKIKELLKNSKMDNESIYNLLYDLHFFMALAEAEDDIRNGRVMSLEESKERIKVKYAKYNIEQSSRRYR